MLYTYFVCAHSHHRENNSDDELETIIAYYTITLYTTHEIEGLLYHVV